MAAKERTIQGRHCLVRLTRCNEHKEYCTIEIVPGTASNHHKLRLAKHDPVLCCDDDKEMGLICAKAVVDVFPALRPPDKPELEWVGAMLRPPLTHGVLVAFWCKKLGEPYIVWFKKGCLECWINGIASWCPTCRAPITSLYSIYAEGPREIPVELAQRAADAHVELAKTMTFVCLKCHELFSLEPLQDFAPICGKPYWTRNENVAFATLQKLIPRDMREKVWMEAITAGETIPRADRSGALPGNTKSQGRRSGKPDPRREKRRRRRADH